MSTDFFPFQWAPMVCDRLVQKLKIVFIFHQVTICFAPLISFPVRHPKPHRVQQKIRICSNAQSPDFVTISQSNCFSCCLYLGCVASSSSRYGQRAISVTQNKINLKNWEFARFTLSHLKIIHSQWIIWSEIDSVSCSHIESSIVLARASDVHDVKTIAVILKTSSLDRQHFNFSSISLVAPLKYELRMTVKSAEMPKPIKPFIRSSIFVCIAYLVKSP